MIFFCIALISPNVALSKKKCRQSSWNIANSRTERAIDSFNTTKEWYNNVCIDWELVTDHRYSDQGKCYFIRKHDEDLNRVKIRGNNPENYFVEAIEKWEELRQICKGENKEIATGALESIKDIYEEYRYLVDEEIRICLDQQRRLKDRYCQNGAIRETFIGNFVMRHAPQ